ncbi:MAG: helix-turn-helix domain-containing protein [Acidobacteria bacterium]|jgi:DNA-binding HxlR family transcriptional regulator|nr:helix-turn-helix domain-containing protein [Acidobacteriota bacterium]
MIYTYPMDTEELVQQTLDRVADKWTLNVIEELHNGELRFSQLQKRIPSISQKMLTKTLRQLERDGLVTRFVHATVPPRVDYNLTPLGESLSEAVCSIWLWAEKHGADVQAARNRFDQSPTV